MNETFLTDSTLLLLTSTTESATRWRRELHRCKVNFVIDTYESAFLDRFAETYGLVIVDANNTGPWEDTLDRCHRIRRQMNIPLILLTESRDEDQLLKAYEVGVNECIGKPIGTELLLAKANAWLRFWKKSC